MSWFSRVSPPPRLRGEGQGQPAEARAAPHSALRAIFSPRAGRRAPGAAAALLLASGLSGCFTPLYGEAAHPGLVEDMRAIEVAPIPNRIGHYLADNLITDVNGTGQTVLPPKYRLTVTVSLGTQTPTVNSELNVATSATLTADANYSLVKLDGNKEVVKGVALAAAAYDRTTQRYADLRAARDAEIRLARTLSSEISQRVATALAAKTS
jgi:LPS-assembly lipoprotein